MMELCLPSTLESVKKLWVFHMNYVIYDAIFSVLGYNNLVILVKLFTQKGLG